jgi:hypothetical protein
MSEQSGDTTALDTSPIPRSQQLQWTADQLEAVLQSINLEANTELADEVARAFRATERAREMAAYGDSKARGRGA